MAELRVIQVPPAPNLPVAPNVYSTQHFDVHNNVLRLYFNRLSSALSALFGSAGGKYLKFPYFSAYQDGVTTLTADITSPSSTAAIQVASTAGFPSSGYILIENEIIGYTTTTATSFDGTITRGALGSTAGKAAHSSGTYVSEAAGVTSTTAAAMRLNVVTVSNDITCTTPDTKVYLGSDGYYNIQFSAQFLNYSGNDDDVTVWFKKNNIDVDFSASVAQVPPKHALGPGATILALNYIDSFAADDYFELYWSSKSGETILSTFPPATSPTRPASPSLILTVTFVSAL